MLTRQSLRHKKASEPAYLLGSLAFLWYVYGRVLDLSVHLLGEGWPVVRSPEKPSFPEEASDWPGLKWSFLWLLSSKNDPHSPKFCLLGPETNLPRAPLACYTEFQSSIFAVLTAGRSFFYGLENPEPPRGSYFI